MLSKTFHVSSCLEKLGTFLCIHYTVKNKQTNKQKVFHFPYFKTCVPKANYGGVKEFELLHL